MVTTAERRARAESIVQTMAATTGAGIGGCQDEQQATYVAEALQVPIALVWAAMDGMSVDDIDALVAWWPTRGGA